MFNLLILIGVIIGICLDLYIIKLLTKKDTETGKKEEGFCNCFASQYDGSSAQPNSKCYYGGICYDKERITKLYNEGKFDPEFAGV